MKALLRNLREAWEVPRDLLLGRYPEFVTGGALPKGQVPVFVFHSLEPESFERRLRHLSENGYETLSVEQYFEILMGARAAPERAVVLTFDDGRGSLWSVGYPLLKRYGMKGTVFLVPGRVESRPGPPLPTWEDARQGHAAPRAVLERDAGPDAFLSWQEVETLAHEGVFDFESHTLTHGRVHVHPRVVGFVTPWARQGCAAMDIPLVRERDRDLMGSEVPLGTPLLRSAPRTAEVLRFLEAPDLRRRTVARVSQGGGEAFFLGKGWRAELQRSLDRRELEGRLETPAEREEALRRELTESRRLIEEHTGRPAVHLCYPWHASGETVRRLAREVGYRTAFCGKVPGVPLTLAGGDPHSIARIGEDYLELLPGEGRSDLRAVVGFKWRRRFRGRP